VEGACRSIVRDPERKAVVDRVIIVEGHTHLFQVVDALRTASRLARRLDGGKQERDQNGNDRDHDEQLDQGEAATISHGYTPQANEFGSSGEPLRRYHDSRTQ